MRKSKSFKPPVQDIWQKYHEAYDEYHNAIHWTKIMLAMGDWFFELSAYIIASYFLSTVGPRRRHTNFSKKRNRNI